MGLSFSLPRNILGQRLSIPPCHVPALGASEEAVNARCPRDGVSVDAVSASCCPAAGSFTCGLDWSGSRIIVGFCRLVRPWSYDKLCRLAKLSMQSNWSWWPSAKIMSADFGHHASGPKSKHKRKSIRFDFFSAFGLQTQVQLGSDASGTLSRPWSSDPLTMFKHCSG